MAGPIAAAAAGNPHSLPGLWRARVGRYAESASRIERFGQAQIQTAILGGKQHGYDTRGRTLMTSPAKSAIATGLRAGLLAALASSVAACVFFSRGWGVGQDSRLMHYIVFLMQHGFAPYRDIVDMNMPVTYMVEWAGMRVFGAGDGAWRCFDLFLLLLGCAAAAMLARPRGGFAATSAALLVALCHFSGGAFDAAQRDYTLAVFLLIGTAALFLAMRRQRAWPMVIFAACFGFAAGIKPFVIPLPFALLLAALLHLRRNGAKTRAHFAASLAGAAISIAAVCLFLQHYHAWQAFFGPIAALAQYHRGNGNMPLQELLLRWLPHVFAPLFALAAIAACRRRAWQWEDSVLLAIGLFGLAGYFYQGKGWSYHAATALMFFSVLTARLLADSLANASSRFAWNVAVALVLLLPASYLPVSLARHPHHDPDKVEASLRGDLTALGAQQDGGVAALSGHIQCMDWNSGCLGALYRLRLLPVAGDIFDFWLFPAHPTAITTELQGNFFAKVQAAPPQVFVITAHDWPAQQGFAKLDRWPEFAAWLNANYMIALERHEWMTENRRPVDRGYRIYVRR
jgi:hypothetical protein